MLKHDTMSIMNTDNASRAYTLALTARKAEEIYKGNTLLAIFLLLYVRFFSSI